MAAGLERELVGRCLGLVGAIYRDLSAGGSCLYLDRDLVATTAEELLELGLLRDRLQGIRIVVALAPSQMDAGAEVAEPGFSENYAVVSGRKRELGGRELAGIFAINRDGGAGGIAVDLGAGDLGSELGGEHGLLAGADLDAAAGAGVARKGEDDRVRTGGERWRGEGRVPGRIAASIYLDLGAVGDGVDY